MNHISNTLINTYKPLNTLPGLIPRNFKLTCTCKHAHTQSWGISSCPLTPAAPCSPLVPPQVGAPHWGGLPCLLPVLQVLTAPWGAGSAVPARGQGAAGCLCRGHIRFWLLLFPNHHLHPHYKLRSFFHISFQAHSFFASKVSVIPLLLFTLVCGHLPL